MAAIAVALMAPGSALAVKTTVLPQGSANDGTQMVNGTVLTKDRDLELGYLNGKRTSAVRYTLNVPQGAVIDTARVQFRAIAKSGGVAKVTIHAQDVDNAGALVTTRNNISGRVKTSANVSWNIPTWDSPGHRRPGRAISRHSKSNSGSS